MLLPATDEQVVEMAKLAVLASAPVGLGFLYHDPSLTKDAINIAFDGRGVFIDYYQGRMVKFRSWKKDGGWEFPDAISHDYESWIRTYPSYGALFESASKVAAVDPVDEKVTG